jgi:hypothetical protein
VEELRDIVATRLDGELDGVCGDDDDEQCFGTVAASGSVGDGCGCLGEYADGGCRCREWFFRDGWFFIDERRTGGERAVARIVACVARRASE